MYVERQRNKLRKTTKKSWAKRKKEVCIHLWAHFTLSEKIRCHFRWFVPATGICNCSESEKESRWEWSRCCRLCVRKAGKGCCQCVAQYPRTKYTYIYMACLIVPRLFDSLCKICNISFPTIHTQCQLCQRNRKKATTTTENCNVSRKILLAREYKSSRRWETKTL